MAKQATNQTNEVAEKPCKIEIENLVDFSKRSVGLVDFVTSVDVCNLVNKLMRSTFADYEGSTFDIDSTNGRPIISVFFNHRRTEPDSIVAFTQNIEGDEIKNTTVSRVIHQDRLRREGNSFKITKDGKTALEDFIYDVYKDRNGVPQWKNIVVDANQPGTREMVSKVYGLDPAKFYETVFGNKIFDEDGKMIAEYNYGFELRSSLTPNSYNGGVGNVWLLKVTQINKDALDRALRDAGIANSNGLGIIK